MLCQLFQKRSRPPVFAVCLLEFADALVHFPESHGVCIPHRPAAIGGKAVAVEINNVDIDRSKGETFIQNSRPFVDERVDTALDDFLRRNFALLDSRSLGSNCAPIPPLPDRRPDGAARRSDTSRPVFWPNRPISHSLSSASACRTPGFSRWRCSLRMRQPMSSPARSATDNGPIAIPKSKSARSTASMLAPSSTRELSFAPVRVKHAIADESAAVAYQHADLAELLRQLHACRDRPCQVAAPRTISSRRITFAGLKKCVPMTASGRFVADAISSMLSVDVLLAKIASGLQTRVQFAKDLLLQRHAFKHRFNHHIHVLESVVAQIGVISAMRSSAYSCVNRPRFTEFA